jgi:oxaloacetate decarboxylase beta subunit
VNFESFLYNTGFAHLALGNVAMILIGIIFIYLAVVKDYEPLLLIPIGLGIIVGNVPPIKGMLLGVYDEGSVLYYLYFGVTKGIYPPLIFLGIGAMTDFSTMLSNPKLILLGAAAQIGIFLTFLGSLYLGFTPAQAGSIGIIGGADGPTAIFLSSMLAPELLGPIAIAAYSYMALVPVIQPPIMYLFTTEEERKIHMKPPRVVSRKEKIIFPVVAFLICAMIAPGSIALLGMLFFGNLLKESTVTDRLATSARHALIDIVTILLGFTVGASTQAQTFLTPKSIFICQVHEPLSERKNKPPHRCGRCLGCARFSPGGPDGWPEGGSHQLSAYACHGPECGRSNRLRHSRRCSLVSAWKFLALRLRICYSTRLRICINWSMLL